ncbi:salicylate synthase [Streptosporangium sp. NPDC000396]|uniref:salicylate synthase n=1 Tax=Streptosporangium sp. NPDC000396 TaxID=3366185 RepID=UPI0036ADAF68
MTGIGYHERRVVLSTDPLATAAALAAASEEDHVLYENRDEVSWAEGEHATLSVRADGVTLTEPGNDQYFPADGAPLDAVARALGRLRPRGWRAYGWATFELSYALHGLDRLLPPTPLAHLVIPRREIRLSGGTALLRALDPGDLDSLERRLAAAGREPAREQVSAEVETYGRDSYRRAVADAVTEIGAGRLDKVILSRVVPVPFEIDLPATYLAGRRANAPARSFLLRLGGWQAAGFSPEIITRVSADGLVLTQPLAGTRAFDGDPDTDRKRREELYRDAKEVFEHAISVRLAGEELAGTCEPGTVRVDDFMSVKERGSVQHLASQVSGRLAPGRSGWDALAALFPAVTASGIPKAAACELIHRSEPEERGLYSGAVLTADADGTVDAALVLRSVFRRAGRTWLRAGAGIVEHSTPDRELEETCEKLRSVSRFLVPAPGAGERPSVEAEALSYSSTVM